jgi:anti-sigma regulatory factor (Ser/Thr protein kinase)
LKDLSLHILDIIENSIEAGAKKVEISIEESTKKNMLVLKIKDDGRGMDKKTLTKVLNPFFTTKKAKRIGLGLSMLAQSTKEAGGSFDIKSKKEKGTSITAKFVYDHIDRKPIGNMAETMIALIVSNGLQTDLVYKHSKNGKNFLFDTRYVKKELNGVLINKPEVLSLLRKWILKELKRIKVGT